MLTAMGVWEYVGRVGALIYGYLIQLYVQLYRSAKTKTSSVYNNSRKPSKSFDELPPKCSVSRR